mmetsp:Transcript_94280/g.293264  ORF Transcript_94280/g.293264 Transcript_94280/m.293264 type:complete len:140 (+) Transcript_94280:930-1349(+)
MAGSGVAAIASEASMLHQWRRHRWRTADQRSHAPTSTTCPDLEGLRLKKRCKRFVRNGSHGCHLDSGMVATSQLGRLTLAHVEGRLDDAAEMLASGLPLTAPDALVAAAVPVSAEDCGSAPGCAAVAEASLGYGASKTS